MYAIRSYYDPVIVSGHEVIVWPYKKGVCAILTEGPEAVITSYSIHYTKLYDTKKGLRDAILQEL